MVETAFDQSPEDEHRLGKFRRWRAEFSVVFLDSTPGVPTTYRVDCDDGVGPREVCRFVDDPDEPVIWRGAWNGDEWCDWIMERARQLVARPSHYDY